MNEKRSQRENIFKIFSNEKCQFDYGADCFVTVAIAIAVAAAGKRVRIVLVF